MSRTRTKRHGEPKRKRERGRRSARRARRSVSRRLSVSVSRVASIPHTLAPLLGQVKYPTTPTANPRTEHPFGDARHLTSPYLTHYDRQQRGNTPTNKGESDAYSTRDYRRDSVVRSRQPNHGRRNEGLRRQSQEHAQAQAITATRTDTDTLTHRHGNARRTPRKHNTHTKGDTRNGRTRAIRDGIRRRSNGNVRLRRNRDATRQAQAITASAPTRRAHGERYAPTHGDTPTDTHRHTATRTPTRTPIRRANRHRDAPTA